MRYRLIIWDFDGTLADTLRGGISIFNELAAKYGCLPIDDVELARTLSSRQLLVQHRVSRIKLPFLVRELIRRQRAELESVRIFPQLPEVLRQLHDCGTQLGVLSSNAEENIRRCLGAHGLDELFCFVAGGIRLQGKKRPMRRILRQHNLRPDECLYVGDEVRDVRAAHAVGIDVAAVSWGFQGRALLAAEQPTFLIDRPEELLTVTGVGMPL